MADDTNPIEKMTPGQVLADASVAEFIKAMGLSIAEAQKALDANSLAMMGEYVEPQQGLAGPDGRPKSLLQLGLSPPFYHYQHADLTVSMQLMMKVGKASAFGIGGKVDLGLSTGASATVKTRTAQLKLKKLPASVTLNGTKTDATGPALEAAGEQLAKALRTPTGKFEQVLVSSKKTAVKAELEPAAAKNPLLTPGAVAFLPSSANSSGVIRIQTVPPAGGQPETYTLDANKTANVPSEANKLLFARKVTAAINTLGGFKARLARDPGGNEATPDVPGTLAIALFDTASAVLQPAALAELRGAAQLIKAGALEVQVIGYADVRGSNDYNTKLGQQRADSVAAQLKAFQVDPAKIATVSSNGEERWAGMSPPADNPQFRRVEVLVKGNQDLFIVVESDTLQLADKPLPDLTAGGSGNGFIIVRKAAAQAIDGTAVKVGESLTSVALSGAAVNTNDATFGAGSPEAHAFNLTKAINDGSAASKVRATRQGSVVLLAAADDAVMLDLTTVSDGELKLSAEGGAEVTKALEELKPAGPTANKDKPNVTVAVGITADYRSSRQFEQSINGNSSISARLVAVPAPVEFLDQMKKFLSEDAPADTPPTPTPTP